MILLNSNAQHIFWLGRYIARVQYLCSCFPFKNDLDAMEYAHAFGLPAFDATSLNELILDDDHSSSFKQQFTYMKNNIYELRGVLSARGYAEFGQLIKLASENSGYICDVVNDCRDLFESEAHDVFLFFTLGQALEQLDRKIRLTQPVSDSINEIDQIILQLHDIGWDGLSEVWLSLKASPDGYTHYQFSDFIQNMFEVAA